MRDHSIPRGGDGRSIPNLRTASKTQDFDICYSGAISLSAMHRA